MASCPDCEFRIEEVDGEIESGESIECPECGIPLIVAQLDPLVLHADEQENDYEDEPASSNDASDDEHDGEP